jgi:L-lysine 6-transaminase
MFDGSTKKGNFEITPQNVHEALRQLILVDGFDLVLDLDRSQGSYLYDALKERCFLDFFSFVASLPIGYNHSKMSDPDFRRKLLRAALIKPSNSDVYTTEYAAFVTAFAHFAGQGMFRHYFL